MGSQQIVHLGFEIFVPYLRMALNAEQMNNRLIATIDELKKSNITQAKQLAATEQRLNQLNSYRNIPIRTRAYAQISYICKWRGTSSTRSCSHSVDPSFPLRPLSRASRRLRHRGFGWWPTPRASLRRRNLWQMNATD